MQGLFSSCVLMNENNKYMFELINQKKFLGIAFGILIFLVGIVLLFVYREDFTFGICGIVIGVVVSIYSYFKYGRLDENKIEVIKAICVDKSRSGYRGQYLNYVFEIEDGDAFTLTTAQKEKFRKHLSYIMCFKKTSGDFKYTGTTLLAFKESTKIPSYNIDIQKKDNNDV